MNSCREALVSISFQNLGSSSGGNATLLLCRHEDRVHRFLLDAGLGPRTVAKRLRECGHSEQRLDGIILTHADSDHMRATWRATLERQRIPVHVWTPHREEACRKGVPRSLVRAHEGTFEPGAGVRVCCYRTPHDQSGSCALRIECGEVTLGWATDLGRADDGLVDHLAGVDALGIESNYDPGLQSASHRPEMLVRRITGGRGHLSNQECLDAVRRITGATLRSQPLDVVCLLHLSRDCNRPTIVQELWSRMGDELVETLEIARPDGPGRLHGLRPHAPTATQAELFT